jgi:hypothetical protein
MVLKRAAADTGVETRPGSGLYGSLFVVCFDARLSFRRTAGGIVTSQKENSIAPPSTRLLHDIVLGIVTSPVVRRRRRYRDVTQGAPPASPLAGAP